MCEYKNQKVAAGLFAACLRKIAPDEQVYVGVPEVNKEAQEILADFGFSRYSKSIRMSLGLGMEHLHEGMIQQGGGCGN